MADIADLASMQSEIVLDFSILKIRMAAEIQPGVPGECELCGEESLRLVDGTCAPCRDKWGRK